MHPACKKGKIDRRLFIAGDMNSITAESQPAFRLFQFVGGFGEQYGGQLVCGILDRIAGDVGLAAG